MKRTLIFGKVTKNVQRCWSLVWQAKACVKYGQEITKLAVPLTKVFGGSGPICTYHMKEIEFVFKLPTSEVSPKVWEKDNTIEEIKVNIPLRRIRALVLLFKEKRKESTEEFANPNIENAKVSVEGVPFQVFNNYGIRASDIYKEGVQLFGDPKHPEQNVGKVNFLTGGQYAFVIDFRAVPEEDVVDTGRKLIGTQAGLLIEIKKKATTKDLIVYLFAIADASLYISEGETKLSVNR